jgi:hypothetical protein
LSLNLEETSLSSSPTVTSPKLLISSTLKSELPPLSQVPSPPRMSSSPLDPLVLIPDKLVSSVTWVLPPRLSRLKLKS